MVEASRAPSGKAGITPEVFRAQVAQLAAQLAGRALDASLDAWLNEHHGAGSPTFEALCESCRVGVRDGWLCEREGGGIRYGRIFKPADDLAGFSVDVVDMQDIAGPHHTPRWARSTSSCPSKARRSSTADRPAGASTGLAPRTGRP